LVVSLNHQLPAPGMYAEVTAANAWDTWREHSRKVWYPGFYRPLTHLAGAVRGDSIELEAEADFATERMVFTELCPVRRKASPGGMRTCGGWRRTMSGSRPPLASGRSLIEDGEPALILVNGVPAVSAM